MGKLLSTLQAFFREHSEHWVERFHYKEAGPRGIELLGGAVEDAPDPVRVLQALVGATACTQGS